jgi:TDG/mug DNA glycosylase family protein
LHPSEYATLLDQGIGLTDLCKGASGNDDELPRGALDGKALREKIERFGPATVAFTSKNAARAFLGRDVIYGWQPEQAGDTRFFVLPSPSGQAARYWDLAPWQALARDSGYLQGPM